MDSPRSGFRRAAATSWALTGIGIAGVAGASALSYADTVKPPSSDTATDVVVPAPVDPGAQPGLLAVAPPPDVLTPTIAPPPPPVTTAAPVPEVIPETTVEQAPVVTRTRQYVPETTVQQAPVTTEAPAPVTKTPPTTTRKRQLTPTTVMAPNYSPPIVRSRGS